MKVRQRSRAILVLLGLSVGAYIGSYATLSLRGRYEPAAIGTNGVKLYLWAPRGFVQDLRWNRRITLLFAPLYWADTRFWHRSEEALDGRYPVDKIEVADVGRVYRAWVRP